MRIRFDEQLELLNRKLIEMGALCEDAISASMHTLKNEADKKSAEKAAALEREIDHKEREIESLCMKLLLQQQPVARDLRTISSALKMISDLERIGDEVVSMAEQAILMQDMPGYGVIPHVRVMFDKARQAFEQAVVIFRANDAGAALDMSRGEDEAVQCEVRIIQGIMERLSGHGADMEPHLAMHIILVARSLTRIWRRSINIAEHVYFINQGLTLKHHGELADEAEDGPRVREARAGEE